MQNKGRKMDSYALSPLDIRAAVSTKAAVASVWNAGSREKITVYPAVEAACQGTYLITLMRKANMLYGFLSIYIPHFSKFIHTRLSVKISVYHESNYALPYPERDFRANLARKSEGFKRP